jgi:hypothetical protein
MMTRAAVGQEEEQSRDRVVIISESFSRRRGSSERRGWTGLQIKIIEEAWSMSVVCSQKTTSDRVWGRSIEEMSDGQGGGVDLEHAVVGIEDVEEEMTLRLMETQAQRSATQLFSSAIPWQLP